MTPTLDNGGTVFHAGPLTKGRSVPLGARSGLTPP